MVTQCGSCGLFVSPLFKDACKRCGSHDKELVD